VTQCGRFDTGTRTLEATTLCGMLYYLVFCLLMSDEQAAQAGQPVEVELIIAT
jgi:hypothetical protein